jgi:8-oxo-dGTP diphosphatase
MKTKIRVTVVCARGESVLLVSKDGIRWMLPGGRPGTEEAFVDAAERRLREETSLLAREISSLFQVISATNVHHVFGANLGKSAAPVPGKDIGQCQWFSPAELREIVIGATTRQIIESFWRVRNR